MERRLVAILAADMVGYSRLMGADEEGTIARQREHRAVLIDPEIAGHGGRIVKTMGDGLLVEFASVVDALKCAVAVQAGMAAREGETPEEQRIQFRIGINLGDIVIDGDDILGDGVNVAARLEGLAEPGGICISDVVHQSVEGKLELAFADMGAQQVKNIVRPVRAFQVLLTGASEPKSDELPLPDKPSIAVLPFNNMSGDPEQEYFADGIAEDIITALSRFRRLLVTARNTSFAYKGGVGDVSVLGGELGVRYLLEGSVRKAGNRVRITAQLIETDSGNHAWAERYDRELDDIFEVQDEITRHIAIALEPAITMAEIERTKTVRTTNISAWDYYLRALPHFHLVTAEDNALAMVELEMAIEIDPNYVPAIAFLSLGHVYAVLHGWSDSRSAAIGDAGRLAERALAIDPTDPAANLALSWYCLYDEQLERGLTAAKKAAEQEPNSFVAWCQVGALLAHLGRADEAYGALETVQQMSGRDPWRWWWYMNWGNAYFAGGRYNEAVDILLEGKELRPSWYGFYVITAASAANAGRIEVAEQAVADLLKVLPRATMRGFERHPAFAQQTAIDALLNGLRTAGVPES